MTTEDFFDQVGEAVVSIWCDGLECRNWGRAKQLRHPVGKLLLWTAGVFFKLSDTTRAEKT